MLLFPPCKINLGLHILSKRDDNYHNLETLLIAVPELHDILEILPYNRDEFKLTGITLEGKPDNNLVVKSLQLLRQIFDIPPVYIHLHKLIPHGAGLGGGSSDAAYTLLGLNKLFNLNISVSDLKSYCEKLGSDCAFFIEGIPAIATEKGSFLTPFRNEHNAEMFLQIIVPKISISTPEAYKNVVPYNYRPEISSILKKPFSLWKSFLENDFEKSLFPKFRDLEIIKNELYNAGASYASLSGSGSAVYGLFEDKTPDFSNKWKGYFEFKTRVSIPLYHK